HPQLSEILAHYRRYVDSLIVLTNGYGLDISEMLSLKEVSTYMLSIPVTWDFSMHLKFLVVLRHRDHIAFNSRYLGFFHPPSFIVLCLVFKIHNCQFPLLGIFPSTFFYRIVFGV